MIKHFPNLLTLFRIFMIPGLVILYLIPGPLGNWLACLIFYLAAITDYLDGWLARKLQATSEFGRMLDPIADKLMVVAVITILIEFRDISGIHTLAAGLIIMREILISWFREYLTDRGVTLEVSQIAKFKTTIQMIALGILLLGEAGEMISPLIKMTGLGLFWTATFFTIWTAIDYLSKGLALLKEKN